ncbi:hypothetical protein BOM24_01490 [Tatumella sp. OPLPL6]|nr:hypothetical protein BOM24_01490 [Tatumella sp. OPLPL6]
MGEGLRVVVGEGLGASSPGRIIIVAGGHPIQPDLRDKLRIGAPDKLHPVITANHEAANKELTIAKTSLAPVKIICLNAAPLSRRVLSI